MLKLSKKLDAGGLPIAIQALPKKKGGNSFVLLKELPEDKTREEAAAEGLREIKLAKGEPPLFSLPRDDAVERLLVSAPSGAGKSTFVANWIKLFKRLNKQNGGGVPTINILSRVEEDKPLDNLNPERIPLDDEFAFDPPPAEEFENSVVVFDDIETIAIKRLRDAVITLRDDLLECGRHYGTTTLCTSHVLLNGRLSKKPINESTAVVLFPRAGATKHIKSFLDTYMGLERDQIKKIMKLPSRWVYLSRNYPQYVVYERGAYLLG